jgi:hypothetical protein
MQGKMVNILVAAAILSMFWVAANRLRRGILSIRSSFTAGSFTKVLVVAIPPGTITTTRISASA